MARSDAHSHGHRHRERNAPAGAVAAATSRAEAISFAGPRGARPATSVAPADRVTLVAALPLFALSGAAALVYEIVWFQLLGLVVGSTAISLGIVLATYMGGLALGSLLLPRFVSRTQRPFRVYALLELATGAFALLELLLIPAVQRLYGGFGGQGLPGLVLRGCAAAICLLPPTICMGAALPAVARRVESSPAGAAWVGALYTSNLAGGIAGTLAAGFFLLGDGDVVRATVIAAVLNLLAAVGGWLLTRRPFRTLAEIAPASPAPPARAALTVAALSGFTALGAEVVWTRLLALLLGATVYTFSIVLAVFLFGLALGSAFGSALARRRPAIALAAAQLLLAATIAWGAFALTRSLPYWPIAPSLALRPAFSFQIDLARALWAIFPAALLWGATFPLALAAATAPGEDAGRVVGRVYAANTLGAIAGALAFSLAIVPLAGTGRAQQTLAIVAAVAALPAIGLAVRARSRATRFAWSVGIVTIALAALAPVLAAIPPAPRELIAYGRTLAYRLGAWDPLTSSHFQPDLLYVGEGTNESVAVSQEGATRVFHVSGKIEASTSPKDMRLQRMLAHVPALLQGAPESVLIVGCGAGVTAGTFTEYPSVKRIVICELEPLVTREVAPRFAAANDDVMHDPRVTIVFDDARHWLLTTREKFDLITSDPVHPWVKGSAALYSRDWFELVARHLNPGGAVSQWLPLYQASESTIRGEVATFFAAFPNGSVWANDAAAQGYDVVLVGTAGPTRIDLDATAAKLATPPYARVAASLAAVGFHTLPDLLSSYVSRRADLAPWLAGARINRDWQPWLQYQAGLESYTEQEADIGASLARYRVFPDDLFLGSAALKQAVMNAGASGR